MGCHLLLTFTSSQIFPKTLLWSTKVNELQYLVPNVLQNIIFSAEESHAGLEQH